MEKFCDARDVSLSNETDFESFQHRHIGRFIHEVREPGVKRVHHKLGYSQRALKDFWPARQNEGGRRAFEFERFQTWQCQEHFNQSRGEDPRLSVAPGQLQPAHGRADVFPGAQKGEDRYEVARLRVAGGAAELPDGEAVESMPESRPSPDLAYERACEERFFRAVVLPDKFEYDVEEFEGEDALRVLSGGEHSWRVVSCQAVHSESQRNNCRKGVCAAHLTSSGCGVLRGYIKSNAVVTQVQQRPSSDMRVECESQDAHQGLC